MYFNKKYTFLTLNTCVFMNIRGKVTNLFIKDKHILRFLTQPLLDLNDFNI